MGKTNPPTQPTLNIGWTENFTTKLDEIKTTIGFPVLEFNAIVNAKDAFNTSYFAQIAAEAAAKAATSNRNEALADLLRLERAAIKSLLGNSKVTEEMKIELGMTIPKPPTPAPKPSTMPNVSVEQVGGFTQVVRLEDIASNRAKPDGVSAAKIYMKIATVAPVSIDELPLVNIETKSKFDMTFPASEVGKTAWYGISWINQRGEEGPKSLMIGATIAA
jgi:hypothetical protein